MKLPAFALFTAGLALSAPADIEIFHAADLHKLSPANGTTYSDHNLARYRNHYLLLIRREESGASELHEHEADIFVVETGRATILAGGKMVNPHLTKPGEIRGSSIEGGTRHQLSAGDIVHIPAGTPHQLLLEKGKPFTYLVVKVSGQ